MRQTIATLLFALLAGAGASDVQASSQLSVQAAGNSAPASRTSASAAVNFRIVIRETLNFGIAQQNASPTSPQLTRTVSVENRREVQTFARP
ncbi:hypothetical protein [Arenimonas alkanexedens]